MREFRPELVPRSKLAITIPNDWTSFDIEIGAGVGFHPIYYCQRNPDRNLIAFERTQNKFHKFQGRVENHQKIKNLRAVHGDAISWITHNLDRPRIENCFILYPNPYPKASQANQRWHYMPFMGHLLSKILPGGKIHLATNIESYKDECIKTMLEHWGLKLLQSGKVLGKQETYLTHFEKKYLLRGETCYHLVFCKN